MSDSDREDSFNTYNPEDYDEHDIDDEDVDTDKWDQPDQEMKEEPPTTSTSPLPSSSSTSSFPKSREKKEYTCLDESQLFSSMQTLINDVSGVIEEPEQKTALLLRTHNWNKERLIAKYFEDRDAVLKRVGLEHFESADPDAGLTDTETHITCQICDEDVAINDTYSVGCAASHRFCSDCWRTYLSEALHNGPLVIFTHCPYYQCTSLLPDNAFARFLSSKDYARFQHYVLRSYVEDNRTMRWCPSPHCSYAIHTTNLTITGVTCDNCHTSFCFQCNEENHDPATCAQLAAWTAKNLSESQNAHWIIANTKKCPQCQIRIEKNQGCNHIQCRSCGYEWCWVCHGSWKEHGNHTGGFYKCNKYDPKQNSFKQESHIDSTTTTTTTTTTTANGQQAHNNNINTDKTSTTTTTGTTSTTTSSSNTTAAATATEKEARDAELNRYLFYYQRYHNHAQSAKFSSKLLQSTQQRIHSLSLQSHTDVLNIELQFLQQATQTILDVRHVLKYTYVFGYFLPAQTRQQQQEKTLFEFLQQQLEQSCEQLSELSEQRVEVWKKQSEKMKLMNVTRVTQQFKENLLAGIRNGLTG